MSLNEATKLGYGAVKDGAENFLKGLWLQLSRGFILGVWFIIAAFVGGVFAYINPEVGGAMVFISFFTIPIGYGYYKLYQSEGDDNEDSATDPA